MTARRVVHVLGVSQGRLPHGTEALLRECELVVGSRPHLDRFAVDGVATVTLGGDLQPALEAIGEATGRVAVLASGDPGFFGIVRTLGDRLGPAALDVRPGSSAVALAFARLGVPWDDALAVSAHGRDARTALHCALSHPKVAILTSPAAPAAWFVDGLRHTPDREVVVAQRLGTAAERVDRGSPAQLAGRAFDEPNVVVVLGREHRSARSVLWPARHAGRWALEEEAFSHRDGMVTKREVRALALADLGPRPGDLVWDVGCGSGSVAVECARLGAAVVAVDDDPDAVQRTAANADAHDVRVRLAAGRAPAVLADLPDPDAVFVGGGGEDLGAILAVCRDRAHRAIVVTLAVVERVQGALDALSHDGWHAQATMLQASRVAPLGSGHRLAATNPVFVVSGRRT